MSKKVYVGNLPFQTTDNELKDLFSKYGQVQSVSVITDRDTGRSRGFAFVEMDDITKAIAEANGQELGGRKLVVNEARERQPRTGGGGFNRDRGNREGGFNRDRY